VNSAGLPAKALSLSYQAKTYPAVMTKAKEKKYPLRTKALAKWLAGISASVAGVLWHVAWRIRRLANQTMYCRQNIGCACCCAAQTAAAMAHAHVFRVQAAWGCGVHGHFCGMHLPSLSLPLPRRISRWRTRGIFYVGSKSGWARRHRTRLATWRHLFLRAAAPRCFGLAAAWIAYLATSGRGSLAFSSRDSDLHVRKHYQHARALWALGMNIVT